MKINTIVKIFAITLLAGCETPMLKSIYPDQEWKRRAPEKMELDRSVLDKIDSLMKVSEANGILVHKGYLVSEWNYGGAASQKFGVQSITKTIASVVLGLALKDELIPDLDAKVKDYYPDFEVGPYTNEITFRHLVTASSGIKSTITKGRYYDPNNMKPGIESRYHNDHLHQLATALTYLYCKDLGEVFNERILIPIQAQDSMKWGYHSSASIICANGLKAKVVAGYAFSYWTARDLARVGYLYLNDGKWKEKQLLPLKYVKESRRSISIPVMDMSPGVPADKLSTNKYGLAWRGRPHDNGKTLWYMSGNGGQFCVVMPEYKLVMTKINSYKRKPFTGIEQFEELLWNILKNKSTSIDGTVM